MFGTLAIVLADYPDALLLPTNALLMTGEKPAVMVVNDGKAHRQEIRLGVNDGVRMQVLSGCKGDELGITDGKDAARDGEPVKLAK
jgi:HlyD family secretion protein